MNELKNPGGQTRFRQQFCEPDGGQRDFLAGFQDEGVAAGDGGRKHPEGDHGGEIERRDAGAYPQWLSDRIAIDALGHIFQRIAHEERGDRWGIFYHLDAPPDISAGLGQSFSVFCRDGGDQFVDMGFQQGLETEQHLHAIDSGSLPPSGKGRMRGSHRLIHKLRSGGRCRGDCLAGRGIENRGGEPVGILASATVDKVRAGSHQAANLRAPGIARRICRRSILHPP